MKISRPEKGYRQIVFTLSVVILWSIIYLPSLGDPVISRNECRRILPAITMVDSGNWAVPMLGGKPYFNKPPLMNWIIAASYKLTGKHDTWITRLPTTLIVLGFALMLLLMPSSILPSEARFLSSCIFLTTAGMTFLGRTANIDPNYTCLTGAAILLWLQAWGKGISGWRKWLPPAMPLSLGLLLKGPLILFFYYVFVTTVLVSERKKSELLSIPHLCALVFSVSPFFAWSYYAKHVYIHTGHHASMNKVWLHEMLCRFSLNKVRFSLWFRRALGAVAQFLPWLPVFYLAWDKKILATLSEKQHTFIRCARIAILCSFIPVCALPLTKARYSLPLLPLLSITMALLIVQVSLEIEWLLRIKKAVVLLGSFVLAATGLSFMVHLKMTSGLGISNCEAQASTEALSSTCYNSLYLHFAFFTLVIILFFVLRKNLHRLKSSYTLAISFSTVLAIFFALYFAFLFPIKSKSKYHYSEVAKCVDELCKDAEPLVMVGLREVPLGVYLHHKWEMKDGFYSMKTPVKYVILRKNNLKHLGRYLKKHSLHTRTLKYFTIKSHNYILLELKCRS